MSSHFNIFCIGANLKYFSPSWLPQSFSKSKVISAKYYFEYFSNIILILESAKTDLDRKPPGWGKRHTFALLSFLGFANIFAMRVNLSVTIVKMVSQNISVALHQNSSFEEETGCQIPNASADNDIATPSSQLVRIFLKLESKSMHFRRKNLKVRTWNNILNFPALFSKVERRRPKAERAKRF